MSLFYIYTLLCPCVGMWVGALPREGLVRKEKVPSPQRIRGAGQWEGHISGKYDHETIKPEKLTRALIQTCSRPNDIVCVPFAGSGTECAMAAKEKRLFVGFETNLDHVMTARKRVAEILSQPELF